MKSKWIGSVTACAVLAAWAVTVQADPPPSTLWASQIGSIQDDYGYGIAVDGSGNTYITGYTRGDLGGPNQGGADAFITKHDSGGTVQWTSQIGTSEWDEAVGIAVDGTGNSYITGYTYGDLGDPNQGGYDAFIVACDSAGTVQWTRQIGTTEWDEASAIAVDGSGNTYITGYTEGDLAGPHQGGWADAFVVKHDSGGTEQWRRQIGSSGDDYAEGIAVDGTGNSYITGYTYDDFGSPNQGLTDAFVVKYDSDGTEQWRRQIGSSSQDVARGIALDASGNSYIAGLTTSDLGGPNQGEYDAFIVACDSDGTEQWTRQIGTAAWDEATGIAVDGSGNSYITGRTSGNLGGPNQGGIFDAFIVKYDSSGTLLWTREIGTGESDIAEGIGVDAGGNIYITGYTEGDLGGPNQGAEDAFLMAIAPYSATDGDATLNGYVDGLDYVVWSNNYHQSHKWWEEGDFTGEGYVDGLDYILWSNNYLAGFPGQVPEPSCALLLAIGFLALRRRSGD